MHATCRIIRCNLPNDVFMSVGFASAIPSSQPVKNCGSAAANFEKCKKSCVFGGSALSLHRHNLPLRLGCVSASQNGLCEYLPSFWSDREQARLRGKTGSLCGRAVWHAPGS